MKTRILATAVLLAGCQIRELEDTMEGGQVPTRVQDIFDARCNLPGCHGNTPAENLSLLAADSASIIGRNAQQVSQPLVEIGNVNGSYLAIKIMSDAKLMELGLARATGTTRMPQAAVFDAQLEEELAIILGWIAGAELPGGDTGDSGSGSDGMTVDSGSESSGGEVIQECGIDDLKMGAPNPIVSGMNAMEIPPDIGTILADSCGCHYAEMLDVTTVVDYFETQLPMPLRISTWQEWQAQHEPAMKPTKEHVLDRISVPAVGAAMPPPQLGGFGCNLGGGETMPEADRQTLIDWIMADTPDGANWMPG